MNQSPSRKYCLITWSIPVAFFHLQGSRGDVGLPGLIGTKGSKGDTGNDGIKGQRGDTGITVSIPPLPPPPNTHTHTRPQERYSLLSWNVKISTVNTCVRKTCKLIVKHELSVWSKSIRTEKSNKTKIFPTEQNSN